MVIPLPSPLGRRGRELLSPFRHVGAAGHLDLNAYRDCSGSRLEATGGNSKVLKKEMVVKRMAPTSRVCESRGGGHRRIQQTV